MGIEMRRGYSAETTPRAILLLLSFRSVEAITQKNSHANHLPLNAILVSVSVVFVRFYDILRKHLP